MLFTIDHIDREIIRALLQNGRMPLVQLAEQVGLSATPCKRRLERLEESGLISGYKAQIDNRAAGFGITAFVSIELKSQDAKKIADFQRRVALFDEVVTGTLMTGSQDFLLEVAVESLEEFETFLQTKLMPLDSILVIRSRFALRKFVERARIPR